LRVSEKRRSLFLITGKRHSGADGREIRVLPAETNGGAPVYRNAKPRISAMVNLKRQNCACAAASSPAIVFAFPERGVSPVAGRPGFFAHNNGPAVIQCQPRDAVGAQTDVRRGIERHRIQDGRAATAGDDPTEGLRAARPRCELMAPGKLIGEVARRHQVMLGRDDPVLVMATVSEMAM
jgi:hypothetical protein